MGNQLNKKVPEGHNVPYCPEIYTVFVAVKIEQFNSAAHSRLHSTKTAERVVSVCFSR